MDYEGNIKEISNSEAKFKYRNSIFKNKEYIILKVELHLAKGDRTEIVSKMEEYKNWRKEKQPLEYPNAGSTFKRGTEYITAALIDQAGLKGYQIGDAQISEKHAGFIVNKGNATSEDVLKLIEQTKKIIKEKFNKDIEMEIEIYGTE